ncbi:MAG: hypothetical protein AAF340_07330 [Pseudomonadota bacterium]
MSHRESIRGMIVTSGGDKIPAAVTFHPTNRVDEYDQIACVDVPELWMDEYVHNPAGFSFRSTEGECFAQIHVLDAFGLADDKPSYEGKIYLLRAPVVPTSVAAASLLAGRPSSTPHFAGE